jgi:hypothetical protein
MYRLKRLLRVTLLISLLLLSACSSFATPAAGPLIPGLAKTLAAQTLTAQQIFIPLATQPARANVAPPSNANLPTSTPQAIQTAAPPLAAKNNLQLDTSVDCVNAAQFVKDISIPDNATVKSRQRFTKTWQFKNVGTCIWQPDYALTFIWGEQMSGVTPWPLGVTVPPGETIDISISLVAPKEGGMYQGNWIFMDSSGEHFGTGYKARDFFWVAIEVPGNRGGGAGGGFCLSGG